MQNKRGLLLVVSGPSGAGKGTVCKRLVEKRSDVFLSVSATTRAPREGEVDGKHYYFISEEEFTERIRTGGMLEHAVFCGNYYGTPKQAVDDMLAAGKNVILEIEVQGAMKVRSHYPEGVYIFVLPPSMQELRSRLIGRGTEAPEVVEERGSLRIFRNITIFYLTTMWKRPFAGSRRLLTRSTAGQKEI